MRRDQPILLKPFVILTYVLLLAPLVVIVAISFGSSPNYDFLLFGFSLRWYETCFSSREFVPSVFSGQPSAWPPWPQ